MESSTQLVIFAGLVIGLVYGAVGLLSGFCLMSSMRGWLAEGDGRLVRTYALAIAVATAASQFFAGNGMVDLSKSIYLQQSFSVPVLLLGGLLFGYGMVLSNGCGSRALVLLGRGNLRSFVVVVVLAIAAQMTLKGLIAPARIALVQASQTTVHLNSLPSLLATFGPAEAVFAPDCCCCHRRCAHPVCFRTPTFPAFARTDRSRCNRRSSRRRRLVRHRLSRRG
ncbi:putative membrane protein YedE/YeeE [Bradyrhizobium sp. LM3.2]